MKRYQRYLIMLSFLSALCGPMAGCAIFAPRQNEGDGIAAQLKAGMTRQEVGSALGPNHFDGKFNWPRDYLPFLGAEVVPYDLLATLPEGADKWEYGYWVNTNTTHTFTIFFDEAGRVMGWSKPHSDFSQDKYEHERITSRLSYDWLRGTKREKVHKMFGPPKEVINVPMDATRKYFVDHYWALGFDGFRHNERPAPGFIDVYIYDLPSGEKRRVYLVYNPKTNQLGNFGYDHAHEETKLYLREKAGK